MAIRHTNPKKCLAAVAGCLVLAWMLALPAARSQVFNPVADSYIHDANPTVNYGTLTDIYVKKGNTTNFRKGYVKFDLTSASVTAGSTAVLRMYASTSVTVGMNVHQVADSWTENGLTWNNAPAEGAVIATVTLTAAPGYHEWDLTSYVQAQFAGNDKIISVVLYSAAVTSPSILFNSREAATNKPELVVSTGVLPPDPPSDLAATAVSASQINLAWTDNSTNESGFRIESRTGAGTFAEVATTGPGVTSWSNQGLGAGSTWIYRVRAYNVGGNSGYSNEATATTMNPGIVTYYVDATGGNDLNDGLSPASAWKTLTKINATTFAAGNRILFKCGEVWTGRLYPKGSGMSGSPIAIDSYGSGNKPLIDGNGLTGTGTVYLYNQQYWEIRNLEIMNNAASGGDRRGVRIEAENYGTANHICLSGLNIHNIKGMIGQGREEKRTGAIGFAILDASVQETHFNDILVENCQITACENQGIITECVAGDGFDPYTPEWNAIKITNAVIRNNTISGISKNAMILRLFEGGLIEYNLCYNTANGISGNTIFSAACSGTVFQYNEGYGNHSPDADGSLYDPDLRSPNTTWQYSYSHDNAHGLLWTCTVQADANVVCRYNISQNDQGIIFCINYPVTSVRIYNNTVYCPSGLSPIIISERNNGGSGSRTYTFNNNLIYNMSSAATYEFTSGYNRTIDYNCFWGYHPSTEPSDPHKVTGDPKLVAAGSGGTGLSSVSGYKLQPGSSCINKGKVIASNGGKDYWGNPLYNEAPDIGAHEFTLPPAAPSNLSPVVVPPGQINLNWIDNSNNESGFLVERQTNAGTFVQIATLGPGTSTYSGTGAVIDTSYRYRVAAFNTAGNSAYSNACLATDRWTGITGTDWSVASNWGAGVVPDTSCLVVVAPAASNPVVGAAVTVKDLLVSPGGLLTVAPAGNLVVTGQLEIAGENAGSLINAEIQNRQWLPKKP